MLTGWTLSYCQNSKRCKCQERQYRVIISGNALANSCDIIHVNSQWIVSIVRRNLLLGSLIQSFESFIAKREIRTFFETGVKIKLSSSTRNASVISYLKFPAENSHQVGLEHRTIVPLHRYDITCKGIPSIH